MPSLRPPELEVINCKQVIFCLECVNYYCLGIDSPSQDNVDKRKNIAFFQLNRVDKTPVRWNHDFELFAQRIDTDTRLQLRAAHPVGTSVVPVSQGAGKIKGQGFMRFGEHYFA